MRMKELVQFWCPGLDFIIMDLPKVLILIISDQMFK